MAIKNPFEETATAGGRRGYKKPPRGRSQGITHPRLVSQGNTAGRRRWGPEFEQIGGGPNMRMNISQSGQEDIPYSAGRSTWGGLHDIYKYKHGHYPGWGSLADAGLEDKENIQLAELITKGNPGLTQGSNWNWVPGIDYDVPSAGAKGLDAIRGLYNNPVYGKNFRGTVGSIPGNIAEGEGSEGLTIEDIIQTVPAGWQQNFRDVQGIGGFQDPQDVYDQMLYMQQQGNFVV